MLLHKRGHSKLRCLLRQLRPVPLNPIQEICFEAAAGACRRGAVPFNEVYHLSVVRVVQKADDPAEPLMGDVQMVCRHLNVAAAIGLDKVF